MWLRYQFLRGEESDRKKDVYMYISLRGGTEPSKRGQVRGWKNGVLWLRQRGTPSGWRLNLQKVVRKGHGVAKLPKNGIKEKLS